jgi:hypothetical protein
MSFRRERTIISNYPETKSVIVEINYSGHLEGVPDIALLIGDAWHNYCVENGFAPAEAMKMIDSFIAESKK